jgi:hypothetical protein
MVDPSTTGSACPEISKLSYQDKGMISSDLIAFYFYFYFY